jgi:hypothetical protein
MRIEVKVKPGGVAVLRDPLEASGCRVEVTWLRTGRAGRKPIVAPKSVRIIAEGSKPLGFDAPDIEPYLAAFLHKIDALPGAREFWKTTAQTRPEPGRAPKTDFYLGLQAERDRLVAAGERAPSKVIAERMDENPATVRSWLKRADKYIKREGETDG